MLERVLTAASSLFFAHVVDNGGSRTSSYASRLFLAYPPLCLTSRRRGADICAGALPRDGHICVLACCLLAASIIALHLGEEGSILRIWPSSTFFLFHCSQSHTPIELSLGCSLLLLAVSYQRPPVILYMDSAEIYLAYKKMLPPYTGLVRHLAG